MEEFSNFPEDSGNQSVLAFKKMSLAGRILVLVWGVMMAFILIVNLLKSCFPRVLHQYYELETLLPHPVLMFLGWLGLILLFLIIRKIWQDNSETVSAGISGHYPILIIGILFFFIQLYLVYNYFFETDWDVQILLDTARSIAAGGNGHHNSWYYSNYPNNLLLTWFFTLILFITRPLHLGVYDFFAIIVVQSAFCVLTAWMLYQLCIKMWHRRDLVYFCCCIYLLLIGLSPWVSIPYSDSWALLFPVLLLHLRFCVDWRGKVVRKWFSIAFVAWLGFKIKPQVLFIFISILLMDIVFYCASRKKEDYEKPLIVKWLAALFCGLFVSASVMFLLEKSLPVHCDHNQTIGMTHYLMMGMNQNSMGDYNDEDVQFSRSFETKSARSAANLKETVRRVREMGVGGFSELMCEKMLVTYYDGTFFWGKEGWFYKTVFPERNRHLSPFLRNLYYNRLIHGEYYPWWCSFATAVWLGVLVLAFFSLFGKWNRMLKITALSIILLTVYELFFEARARYLYAYIPMYILMAVQGAETLSAKWVIWRSKHKEKNISRS